MRSPRTDAVPQLACRARWIRCVGYVSGPVQAKRSSRYELNRRPSANTDGRRFPTGWRSHWVTTLDGSKTTRFGQLQGVTLLALQGVDLRDHQGVPQIDPLE